MNGSSEAFSPRAVLGTWAALIALGIAIVTWSQIPFSVVAVVVVVAVAFLLSLVIQAPISIGLFWLIEWPATYALRSLRLIDSFDDMTQQVDGEVEQLETHYPMSVFNSEERLNILLDNIFALATGIRETPLRGLHCNLMELRNGDLRMVRHCGYYDSSRTGHVFSPRSSLEVPIGMFEGVCGRALRTGQIQIQNDMRRESEVVDREELSYLKSMMSIPFTCDGVTGSLNIDSRVLNSFRPEWVYKNRGSKIRDLLQKAYQASGQG